MKLLRPTGVVCEGQLMPRQRQQQQQQVVDLRDLVKSNGSLRHVFLRPNRRCALDNLLGPHTMPNAPIHQSCLVYFRFYVNTLHS